MIVGFPPQCINLLLIPFTVAHSDELVCRISCVVFFPTIAAAAFFRFAQDARNFTDKAFRAEADIGLRRRAGAPASIPFEVVGSLPWWEPRSMAIARSIRSRSWIMAVTMSEIGITGRVAHRCNILLSRCSGGLQARLRPVASFSRTSSASWTICPYPDILALTHRETSKATCSKSGTSITGPHGTKHATRYVCLGKEETICSGINGWPLSCGFSITGKDRI